MHLINRLFRVSDDIKAHQEGYSQTELAQKYHVNKSTVNRWIPVLTKHFGIRVDPDDGRLKVDLKNNRIPFDFTIHEVQGICLSMRMMARKFWFPYNDAVTVMDKLAKGTWRFSDILSTQIGQTGLSVSGRTTGDPEKDREIQTALQRLTKAISEHKQVTFRYRKTSADEESIYTMEPYALEPYPEGNGLYLICRYPEGIRQDNDWRKFRFSAMKDITIDARGVFNPDPEFMIEKTTINAWGIWDDKKHEPKTVRLKFTASIAERVVSSKWHESETTEPQPDGSLLFSVTVAEPLEMLPWIRGWGANVEILEPADLRERFREEVKRMSLTYQT